MWQTNFLAKAFTSSHDMCSDICDILFKLLLDSMPCKVLKAFMKILDDVIAHDKHFIQCNNDKCNYPLLHIFQAIKILFSALVRIRVVLIGHSLHKPLTTDYNLIILNVFV